MAFIRTFLAAVSIWILNEPWSSVICTRAVHPDEEKSRFRTGTRGLVAGPCKVAVCKISGGGTSGSTNWHTIEVGCSSLPAHLESGGLEGRCDELSCAQLCQHESCMDDFQVIDPNTPEATCVCIPEEDVEPTTCGEGAVCYPDTDECICTNTALFFDMGGNCNSCEDFDTQGDCEDVSNSDSINTDCFWCGASKPATTPSCKTGLCCESIQEESVCALVDSCRWCGISSDATYPCKTMSETCPISEPSSTPTDSPVPSTSPSTEPPATGDPDTPSVCVSSAFNPTLGAPPSSLPSCTNVASATELKQAIIAATGARLELCSFSFTDPEVIDISSVLDGVSKIDLHCTGTCIFERTGNSPTGRFLHLKTLDSVSLNGDFIFKKGDELIGGGAIMFDNVPHVELIGNSFYNNTSVCGGAVSFLPEFTVPTTPHVAINATIIGCTFIGNYASFGGALCLSPGAPDKVITLGESIFVSNSCGPNGGGGAVYAASASQSSIVDVCSCGPNIFRNNTVLKGTPSVPIDNNFNGFETLVDNCTIMYTLCDVTVCPS